MAGVLFLRRLSLAVISAAGLAACIAIAPTGIHRVTDQGPDGGGGGLIAIDGGPPANIDSDAGGNDPHAVIGVEPAHGPFNGGSRVLVHGKGFTSKARVWFGGTEVDETTTIPIDPNRVQVVAPPGTAGPVDITVQNGTDTSTKRTLVSGYNYDALYAVPDSGPVPGGTVIEIVGQGTMWDSTTVAKIDDKPCTTLMVGGPTQLTCTVPAGSPGSKTISVTTGSQTILVLDGYTYQDSGNGYRGGLSGAPLAGQLKVLTYDNYTGDPVPAALVIAGSDFATALKATSDATGVAVIDDPSLNAPVTVTIAGKCHSPITFVAEPVDTVTAYLDPVLTPACAGMGDPPPVGGKVGTLGQVSGELVWPLIGEFMKGGWSNVPKPLNASQHQVAYLFAASGDPTQAFQLPSESAAVTPSTMGTTGYQFSLPLWPGNRSVYAIAGLQDDSKSPPEFTGYAMGVVNGVPVLPGQMTGSVYISMDKALDQALTINVAPPSPGPKGPDHLRADVAVRLGPDGYALLPAGEKSVFLPTQGMISFVGLPGLNGELTGALFIASARAVTGPSSTAPMSVISAVQTNNTSQVLDMSGFVSVPLLVAPAGNVAWDGMHLQTTFPPGGAPPDLTVYDISSGNGVMHWKIAAPGGSQAITVPSLSGFPDGALPPGPISIGVAGGKVTNFNYAKLLYRQMAPQGMSAYSLDYFDAHL
jgi:hypothetical protein